MAYHRPSVVTLTLGELQHASMNAFLQVQPVEGGGGCECQCQCQCQCQGQVT